MPDNNNPFGGLNGPKNPVVPNKDVNGLPGGGDPFSGLGNVIGTTRRVAQGQTYNFDREAYTGYLGENVRADWALADANKLRAERQSVGAQFLGFANQALMGEVVGGTIGGLGALVEAPEMLYNYITGKSNDFNNAMIQLGEDIRTWSQDATPIYELEPGGSWNVGDSGWWFSRGVSIASTLSMLIPGMAATKGVSYFGKAMKYAAKQGGKKVGLAKVGDAVNDALTLSKRTKNMQNALVGGMAMRHAENTREAFSVVNDIRNESIQAFQDTEKYNEVLNSEIGKEFVKMASKNGVAINATNLADYVASSAGHYTYQINSANLVFDVLQMGAIMNLKGLTRGVERTKKIKAAQSKALTGKEAVKSNLMTKISDYTLNRVNAFALATGAQLGEGVEEIVNFIGGEEGTNYGKEMLGINDEKTTFASRIAGYLQEGEAWEAGFWGVLGGVTFQTVGSGLTGRSKTNDEVNKAVIAQIGNRETALAKFAADEASIATNLATGKISKERAMRERQQLRSALVTNIAMGAARTRSTDLLLEQLDSDDFRQLLFGNMTEEQKKNMTQEELNLRMNQVKSDVLTVENLYKQAYAQQGGKFKDAQSENLAIAQEVSYGMQIHNADRNLAQVKAEVGAKVEAEFDLTKDPNARAKVEYTAATELVNTIQKVLDEKAKNPNVKTEYTEAHLEAAKRRQAELEKHLTALGEKTLTTSVKQETADLLMEQFELEVSREIANSKLNELRTKAGRDKLTKGVEAFNEAITTQKKNAESATYRKSINELVNNKKDKIDELIKELENEVRTQTDEDNKKYAAAKLAEVKKRKNYLDNQKGNPDELSKTEEEKDTSDSPVDNSELELVTDFDRESDAFDKQKITNEDIEDDFKVEDSGMNGARVLKSDGAKAFKAFMERLAKLTDTKVPAEKRLTQLENLFKNPFFLKGRPNARKRIKQEYLKLARHIRKASVAKASRTAMPSDKVAIGEVYTWKGTNLEITDVFENELGSLMVAVSYTDANGTKKKASYPLSYFHTAITSGEMSLFKVEQPVELTEEQKGDFSKAYDAIDNGSIKTIADLLDYIDANGVVIEEYARILLEAVRDAELDNTLTNDIAVTYDNAGILRISIASRTSDVTINDIKYVNEFVNNIVGHESVHAFIIKNLSKTEVATPATNTDAFENYLTVRGFKRSTEYPDFFILEGETGAITVGKTEDGYKVIGVNYKRDADGKPVANKALDMSTQQKTLVFDLQMIEKTAKEVNAKGNYGVDTDFVIFIPTNTESKREALNKKLSKAVTALLTLKNAGTIKDSRVLDIIDTILASGLNEEILAYAITDNAFRAAIMNTPVYTEIMNTLLAESTNPFNALMLKALQTAVAVTTTTNPLPQANIKISEAARKLADEYNLNYEDIVGTGVNGSITKGDVIRFIQTHNVNVADDLFSELSKASPVDNTVVSKGTDNNIFIPFLDHGIVNGQVDAAAYNASIEKAFGFNPGLTQEELEASIKTLSSFTFGVGSRVELTPVGANGGIAIRAVQADGLGPIVGYVNTTKSVKDYLDFVKSIQHLTIAELNKLQQEMIADNKKGSPKWKLLQWRIDTLVNFDSSTHKPFDEAVTMYERQYETTVAIFKTFNDALRNDPMARVITDVTRKTSGTVLQTAEWNTSPEELQPNIDEYWWVDTAPTASNMNVVLVSNKGRKFTRSIDASDYVNHDGQYARGRIYMLMPGANSNPENLNTYYPVPLNSSTLNETDSATALDIVMKIVAKIQDLHKAGKAGSDIIGNEELQDLKKELATMVAVFDSDYQGNKLEEFVTITSDRIIIGLAGGQVGTIYLNLDKPEHGVKLQVKDATGANIIFTPKAGGKPTEALSLNTAKEAFERNVKGLFARKRYNIPVGKKADGLTKAQIKTIFKDRLKTNIEPLKDGKGKPMKDSFGNNLPPIGGKGNPHAKTPSNLIISIDSHVSVFSTAKPTQTTPTAVETVKEALTPDTATTDIAELEAQLAELEEANDIAKDLPEVFIAKMLGTNRFKVTPESAEKETGGKVGKDVNLGFVSKTGKTVQQLAEELSAMKQAQGMDEATVRDLIIEILTTGKNNFIAGYTKDAEIKDLKARIKELKAKVKESEKAGKVVTPKAKTINIANTSTEELGKLRDELMANGIVKTDNKDAAAWLLLNGPKKPGKVISRTEENGVFTLQYRDPISRMKEVKDPNPATANEQTINVDEAKTWWSSVFGDFVPFDTNIIGLIERGGRKAYGIFEDAMVKLSQRAPKGTEFHEAFHVVFWLYLDETQRNELLAEARETYGNLTALDLEEHLADAFMDFMLKQGQTNKVAPKAKNFFKRIWDLIVNFFRRYGTATQSKTDKLFDKIKKGGFKYQPDEKSVNYAKGLSRLKVVDGFTRGQQAEIVSLLSVFYIQYTELANSQEADTAAFPTAAYYTQAMLEDALGAATDPQKQANILSVLDALPEFLPKVREYVNRQFGVEFDEDLDNLEVAGIDKKWDDRQMFSTSAKDSLSNYIKRMIMTTPQATTLNEQGEPIANTNTFLGIQTFLDFNKVYPYIQRNMAGALNIDEMVARLDNMAYHDASIKAIADKLRDNSSVEGINLRAAWFSQFDKQTPEKYVVLVDDSSENTQSKVDLSNKNTSHYLLSNEWKANFMGMLEAGTITLDDVNDVAITFNAAISPLISTGNRNWTANDYTRAAEVISNALNKYGVTVTTEQVLKVITNPTLISRYATDTIDGTSRIIMEVFDKALGSIREDVVKYNNLPAESRAEYGFGSLARLNGISQYVNLFQYDRIESSSFDVKGNNVFGSINPNYLSGFFKTIKAATNALYMNQDQAKEEVLQMLAEFAMNPAMQYSNWLWNTKGNNGAINLTDGAKVIPETVDQINWEFLKVWNYGLLDGIKNLSDTEGQQYGEMSDNAWKDTQLIMYLETGDRDVIRTPLLIPSDSGNIYFITSKRFRGVNDKGVVGENTELYTALYNTLMQEVVRAEAARNLLFKQVDVEVGGGIIKQWVLKEHKSAEDDAYNPEIHVDYHKLEKGYYFQKYDSNNMPILVENGKVTGNVFSFYNFENIGLKETFKPSMKGGETFFDALGFPQLTNDNIASDREDFIKALIADFVENRKKAGIELFSKSLPALRTSSEYAKRYTNHEQFITEYMLNQYLANIEQFNFFVGEHAEYKHGKDTNKRAKEVISPAVRLSLEAAGTHFTAASISDIKLATGIYNNLVTNVAAVVRKEQPNLRNFTIDMTTMRDEKASRNPLEQAVFEITNGYLKINIADGQGYMSIDRYESIVKGAGRWNSNYANLFAKVRRGEDLNKNELTLFLQPVKGFYYDRAYDSYLGRHVSNQVKYSSVPLIPQLIRGTEAERLAQWMQTNNLDEIFFESAEKVGSKHILTIADRDGKLREDVLERYSVANGYTFRRYNNRNWGIQLDVPDHLMDTENTLGTQIAKLAISNLPADVRYSVNGVEYDAQGLIKEYFDTMAANIERDAIDLLNRIGAVAYTKPDGSQGYRFPDKKKLREVLLGEVTRRGISDNYKEAIELVDTLNGEQDFTLPLFMSHMSKKWESILTSLFTNNVTNQKLPGGSAVLLASAFLTNQMGQLSLDQLTDEQLGGINWHRDKLASGTLDLQMTNIDSDGNVIAAEVLLPAWSEQFYKPTYDEDGKLNGYVLDDINNIPEEVRTMLWYRIPSEEKYSMVYAKVVGFLPQSMGSTIVMPKEVVTSTGADFDVDKKFGAIPQFEVTQNADGSQTYTKIKFTQGDEGYEERFQRWVQDKASTRFKRAIESGLSADAKEAKEVAKELEEMYKQLKRATAEFKEQKEATVREALTRLNRLGIVGNSFKEIYERLNNERNAAMQNYQAIPVSDVDMKRYYRVLANTISETINQVNAMYESVVRLSTDALNEHYNIVNQTAGAVDLVYSIYGREQMAALREEFAKLDAYEQNTRAARDNRIIDIWTAIVANPAHYKDTLSPQSFDDAKNVKDKINDLLGLKADAINPMQVEGQLFFRRQNIAGRALKGMAADSNAFLTIAQVSKMKLRQDLGYKVLYPIEQRAALEAKYGRGTVVNVEGVNYIQINHTQLGWNQDGSFDNATGKTTTRHASQMLAMILDIVKEGIPDNVNTYTFYPFITMLNVGIDINHAAMFIRQPVLNRLSEVFFDSKSVFEQSDVQEFQEVKNMYQKRLYALLKQDAAFVKAHDAMIKAIDARMKKDDFQFTREESQALFEVVSGEVTSFTDEQLESALANSNMNTFKTLSNEEKIKLFKMQLKVLETYKTYKKAGEAYSDMLRVFNTDKTPVGPELTRAAALNKRIEQYTYYARETTYGQLQRILDNTGTDLTLGSRGEVGNLLEYYDEFSAQYDDEQRKRRVGARDSTERVSYIEGARVLINVDGVDMPATVAIFPKYFQNNPAHPLYASTTHTSAYSILETYKTWANDLALETLSNEFIEQTPAFNAMFEELQRYTGMQYNSENVAAFSSYIKHLMLSDMEVFRNLDRTRIVGIETKVTKGIAVLDIRKSAVQKKYFFEKDLKMANSSTKAIAFPLAPKDKKYQSSSIAYIKALPTDKVNQNFDAADRVWIFGNLDDHGGITPKENVENFENNYKVTIDAAIAAGVEVFNVGKATGIDTLAANYLISHGYRQVRMSGYNAYVRQGSTVDPTIDIQIVTDPNIDFETFSQLSVPNKVMIMKAKLAEQLANDVHILNYLLPKIDGNTVKRVGSHDMEFINTKGDALTDDALTDSFMEMWNSEDPFIADLAADLINYNFVTASFEMRKNSYGKLIPTQLLSEVLGVGHYLRMEASGMQDPRYFVNRYGDVLDRFIKSNAHNPNIVPIVSNELIESNGEVKRQFIATNDGVLYMSKKAFNNLDAKVQKSPYISVPRYTTYTVKDKVTHKLEGYDLFKLHGKTGERITYYKVSKLGSRNMLEVASSSELGANNTVTLSEEEYAILLERGRSITPAIRKFLANSDIKGVVKFLYTSSDSIIMDTPSKLFSEANTNKAKDKYKFGENVLIMIPDAKFASKLENTAKGERLAGVYRNAYFALTSGANVLTEAGSKLDKHLASLPSNLVRYEYQGAVSYSIDVTSLNLGAFKSAQLSATERDFLYGLYKDNEVNTAGKDCQ